MHYDKISEPSGNFALNGTTLKWYNLAKADEPVPEGIADLATSFLKREDKAGKLTNLGELGFLILHRCGADFYFLLVSTWKNGNELWESVYAKTNNDEPDFAKFPSQDTHRATFCVWELAIVWNEQQAWKRLLLSTGDDNAKHAYLDDHYSGIA